MMTRLIVLFLGLVLLLASGCASTGHWSPAANGPSGKASSPNAAAASLLHNAATLRVANAEAAAAVLAMPGDMTLLHLGNSRMGSLVKQIGVYPAGLMDLLSLQDPHVKYLHSEIITDATPTKLRTLGFYPIEKEWHRNQFIKSFSVYTLSDFPERAPRALEKATSGKWMQTGYCGDFVAWTYDNDIYSWWNQAPVARHVIGHLYPPEAIHTADHLANSPDTKLVIEFLDNKVVYPAVVPTAEHVARLNAAARSGHPQLVRHAREITQLLQTNGILGPDGRVLKRSFRLVF